MTNSEKTEPETEVSYHLVTNMFTMINMYVCACLCVHAYTCVSAHMWGLPPPTHTLTNPLTQSQRGDPQISKNSISRE